MKTHHPRRVCGTFGSTVRAGFSLIELLVVVFIIAALVALLIPAVQAAREAARRAQCANNLKQIGLGMHAYHNAVGSFPTSFWRMTIDPRTGRPDGTNRHSWPTMILPYLEHYTTYNAVNFSVGISGGPMNIFSFINNSALMTSIGIFMCPSDPGPSFSNIQRVDSGVGIKPDGSNANSGPKLSYQGNMGDNYLVRSGYWPFQTPPTSRPQRFGQNGTHTGIMSRSGGIASIRDISDGTSNTFAVGESLFESCNWFTWPNPNGTTASAEVPINWKITSVVEGGAETDDRNSSANWGACMGFRSQHPQTVHFLFCDGRVASVREGIDRSIYRALSTRNQSDIINNNY